MNATRGGNPNDNGNGDTFKNTRLAEIREEYKHHKLTAQEQREQVTGAGDELLQRMRQNGASEVLIAQYAKDFEYADSLMENSHDEDPREKIVSASFSYNNGRSVRDMTITSEGSRHWRQATVNDIGSIVLVVDDCEFGKFNDLGEEPDEEFPDETNTTAIVRKFSGKMQKPWAFDGKFEQLLIVPDEVLEGVKNEAPPGRFFSGKSITDSCQWSPAPDGKTWLEHPFLTNPNGTYLTDVAACFTRKHIECSGRMGREIMVKVWEERESIAYWCPVLKRFLSVGERLRQEHWFHNGDGSAQQRYFYDQYEMLDMHGGLECLPMTVGNEEEVCLVGVTGFEDAIAKRVKEAEAKGKIVEVDIDSKMPAVPDQKKRKRHN